MAKKKPGVKMPVSDDQIEQCLAYAVAEGDIVNFRFLFVPYSPLRDDSTEDIQAERYAYLLPPDETEPRYKAARALVHEVEVRAWVRKQLEKKGPAQLPSELVLALADNAVRLGKYTAASQAYELLRIRRRMQDEFYTQADAALDQNDVGKAVQGYVAAAGLAYDYAAFPEPLPAVPDFQSRALMLHAQYPRRPEDCLALQPDETFLGAATAYLLYSPEAAARIEKRPLAQRRAFLTELIRRREPNWSTFTERYHQACELMRALGAQLEREANRREGVELSLADEVAAQQEDVRPERIPELLLGRAIPGGAWWQYTKELAYEHPAAVLFVARQAISKELETIVPRYRSDSELIRTLGLAGA